MSLIPPHVETLLRLDGLDWFMVLADPVNAPRMPARLFVWGGAVPPQEGRWYFQVPVLPPWEECFSFGVITAQEVHDELIAAGLHVIRLDGTSWTMPELSVYEPAEDFNEPSPSELPPHGLPRHPGPRRRGRPRLLRGG